MNDEVVGNEDALSQNEIEKIALIQVVPRYFALNIQLCVSGLLMDNNEKGLNKVEQGYARN